MLRSGFARTWRCGLLAVGVAIELSGCSTETLETRLANIKAALKSHGIEVHKGKVMRVFRF